MRKLLLIFFVIFCATLAPAPPVEAAVPGYAHYQEVTIDSDAHSLSGNLTDFTLVVHMPSSNTDFWDDAPTNGGHVRFALADNTMLDFQVESYDDSGDDAWWHVQVPTLTSGSNTVFRIFYDISDPSDGSNKEAAWDSDYKMVQHFNSSQAEGICDDATLNNNNCGNQGLNDSVGIIDRGVVSAAGDYATLSDTASLAISGNVTVETWAKWSTSQNNKPWYARWGTVTSYLLLILPTDKPAFIIDVGGNKVATHGSTLNDGAWHFIMGVFDGTNVKISIDGGAFTVGDATSGPIPTGATAPRIGNYSGVTSASPIGDYDETAISASARSLDYAIARHQSGLGTWLTFGTEQDGLVESVEFTDDFNRADSDTLGGDWTEEAAGDFDIVSQTVQTTANTPPSVATITRPAYGTDYWAETHCAFDSGHGGGATCGVVVDYSGDWSSGNGYLGLIRSNGDVELHKVTAGSVSFLTETTGHSVATSPGTAKPLKVRRRGNWIDVYYDDVLEITETVTPFGNTEVGLYANNDAAIVHDNFSSGTLKSILSTYDYGGLVGGITDTSARVFARFDAAATVEMQVEYSTSSDLSSSTTTSVVDATSATEFAQFVEITGLPANTTQYYNILENGTGVFSSPFPSFKTLPSSGNITISFTSCHTDGTAPVFDVAALGGEATSLHLNIGDYGYPDSPLKANQLINLALQADPANDLYSLILKDTPIEWIYDDHDYCGDVEDKDCVGRADAIHSLNNYMPHAPFIAPADGGWRRMYLSNLLAELFIFDGRTQRDPSIDTDNADKSMLDGDNLTYGQKGWFKQALAGSKARWKIIASPSPVNSTLTCDSDNDTFAAYNTEWTEILDFISTSGIENVIVLSGDRHWAAIDDGTNSGLPEFMSSPAGRTKRTSCGTWSEGVFTGTPDHENYGIIDITEASITGYIKDDAGATKISLQVDYVPPGNTIGRFAP